MKARSEWTLEQWEKFSKKLSEIASNRGEQWREKQRAAHLGQKSWSKGNNWRDKYTPEELRAKAAKEMRERRAKNPRMRVDDRVSAMIRQALRARKGGRKWESLVGYSLSDLMAHLEKNFTDGMSWENIGDWHIDHIRPRVSFVFSSPEDAQFKECWSLNNLQPLWAQENLRKGQKT